MIKEPLLSIVCTTYNHARFIRDALDGFVMQKTNFPFEILINDDASTDGTADIVREYESKYPDLFRCVYQAENQWGKKSPWKDILFPMVRGKYVALNEGDDYWTDENKIQKQVDFMESHPDFSICFHPVIMHWDDHCESDSIFPSTEERFGKDVLTLDDLLKSNFIHTNSVMYRWRFHKDSLDLFPDGIFPGDWYLHLLHAQVGKIGFLPDVMSVYRRNQGGVWTGAWALPQWFIRGGTPMVRFYLAMQKQFGKDCKDELEKLSLLTYLHLQKAGKDDLIQELLSLYTPPFDYLKHPFLKYLFYAVISKLCFGKFRKHMRNKRKILKKVSRFSKK